MHKHSLCTSEAFALALLTVHPPGGDQKRKTQGQMPWTISINPLFCLHIYSSELSEKKQSDKSFFFFNSYSAEMFYFKITILALVDLSSR